MFLVGSLAWLATGIMTDQPALVWTNVVLTILNIFGIWRWLGRQAQVEEGARSRSAGERSDARRGTVPGLAADARAGRHAADERSATASTPWPAAAAAGSTMSSFRKAASPASARRCGACRGARRRFEGEARRRQRLEPSEFERLEELAAGRMAGALIVTAELGPADFAWLDRLRRAHYPAERNQLPAHLTMFHALPPSAEGEVAVAPVEPCRGRPPPHASIEGLMDLGGGVAFRIVSPDLERIRDELADGLSRPARRAGLGGWRPHVTIQNKVAPQGRARLLERC